MYNKRQCLIGIFLKSQKGGHISRKRGQKGGLGGQGPKRRAKGGHGRAPPPPPPQKEGSSAAMVSDHNLSINESILLSFLLHILLKNTIFDKFIFLYLL